MMSHYEHLVVFEDRAWGLETAIQGAADRLIPILMTSLVTGLGLLPLALGVGEPGREIEGPMAIAILGGTLHFDGPESSDPSDPCLALCAFRDRSAGRPAREGGGFVTENRRSRAPPLGTPFRESCWTRCRRAALAT